MVLDRDTCPYALALNEELHETTGNSMHVSARRRDLNHRVRSKTKYLGR